MIIQTPFLSDELLSELEQINQHAKQLNHEAEDVLDYQDDKLFSKCFTIWNPIALAIDVKNS
jgi:hypothetical protein